MLFDKFLSDFKRLQGICVTDDIVLLRETMELLSLRMGAVLEKYDSLDETLLDEVDGKTLCPYLDYKREMRDLMVRCERDRYCHCRYEHELGIVEGEIDEFSALIIDGVFTPKKFPNPRSKI